MLFGSKISFSLKVLLAFIVFIIFIVLSLPSIFYFWQFHFGFSNHSEDWGNFGDYLAGTSGVIISILNLIVTIYIAYIVYELNKQHDYKMNRLQLRVNNYNEYAKITTHIIEDICKIKFDNTKNLVNYIKQLRDCIEMYYEAHVYLWEDKKSGNTIKDLLSSYYLYLSEDEGGEKVILQDQYDLINIQTTIQNWNRKLLESFQNIIKAQ